MRTLFGVLAHVAALSALGLAPWAATPAQSKTVKSAPTLRVMLNPATAPRGTLPPATQARLEVLAGTSFSLTGVTRTGALELALGGPRDPASLDAIARRLRGDRALLWAEVGDERRVAAKSAAAVKAAQARGRKLLARFDDAADPAAVVARLATLAGAPLAIERTIGSVQVLSLAQTTSMAELETIAHKLEADRDVRYADPVRRVIPHRVPTDPRYPEQWSLASVNAAMAWDLGTGSSSITVAVVDTGILDHPDLAGRVLPGYDFIAEAERARDGDAREGNPRDEGDWIDDGDCEGASAYPSFFHGLFVAGQIAANADNGIGIAGVDWNAKIVPVRVLGKCGGTIEDVLAGMQWASGMPIAGVPANTNPAKVVNLSLGGFGTCAAAIQEAVDDALAQGTVIVASAGNEADDAASYSPGNCSGVVNVGALSRTGDRSSYSNFGPRIDIAAPGGDIDVDGQILSLHAEGSTTPGEPNYDFGIGTSFSAPLVSGTVALMMARNPNVTPGQVLSILQGSAADFGIGTTCSIGGFCGIGVLDAGTAIASTIPAVVNLPPGGVAVVEFYDASLDHYLMTSDAVEIQNLDTLFAQRWQRTGHVFYAWADPSLAPPGVFPQGVCRFYAGPEHQIDSHFFTVDSAECNYVINNSQGVWTLQTSTAFWVEVPDGTGACRAGTLPVYRFFNGRRDANHRHTIDLSVRRALVNRAWVPDGSAPNGVEFCSLI